MKFTWNTFMRVCGAILAVVVLHSAFWGDGLFCPDCPEPVVDTVVVDSLDWLVSRSELVDSIYVLNEAVDSLEQHIEWLDCDLYGIPYKQLFENQREITRHWYGRVAGSIVGDTIFHRPLSDPCAGMVSIEAVGWVVSVDLEGGFVASQEFTDSLRANRDFVKLTELMAGNDYWFTVKHGSARFGGRGFNISTMMGVTMQRLKDRGQ